MLNFILIISFVSYKFNSIGTFVVAFVIIGLYEYVRFLKFVDPAQIWYVREMLFWLIIMASAYIVFRYTHFWREI